MSTIENSKVKILISIRLRTNKFFSASQSLNNYITDKYDSPIEFEAKFKEIFDFYECFEQSNSIARKFTWTISFKAC